MRTSKERQEINSVINSYIELYKKTKEPITVSFRSKLKHLNNADRYSHLIHSYPAKLLMHIPYFFLNNNIFSQKGDIVLDPFCGTGTVLLESVIAGRRALGADANPLARLIAKVKTQKYDCKKLRKILTKILYRSKHYKEVSIPDVVNVDLWFPKNTQAILARLLKAIKSLNDVNAQDFFLTCLSNCVKKVSYADPRVSVPVRINPARFRDNPDKFIEVNNLLSTIENSNVYSKFKRISLTNIDRIDRLTKNQAHIPKANIISKDARLLTKHLNTSQQLDSESVQLIITSPPYAGAQKYIRSSSLNLGWIELAKVTDLVSLDKENIGRENYKTNELNIQRTRIKEADQLIQKISNIDVVRAKIISQYLIDMKSAINESIRVLKKGGYLVLIVGNNKVCGQEFNTQEYLTTFILKKKLKVVFKLIDDIKSYGLMTKRNKTADIISREWVLVFQK
jgi:DNA modification methylase